MPGSTRKNRSRPSIADMEPYESSVARVDAALTRLNATLEAYRIAGAKLAASNTAKSPPQANGTLSTSAKPTTQTTDRRVDGKLKVQPQAPIEPQPEPVDPLWQEIMNLRLNQAWELQQVSQSHIQSPIEAVKDLQGLLDDHPYSLPIYVLLSHKYFTLDYPDLAAGAAYKALLLSDAVRDSSDEYHVEACAALRDVVAQQPLTHRIAILKEELHAGIEAHEERMLELSEEQDVEMDVWMRGHYLGLIYHMLVQSLVQCGCLDTANEYAQRLKDQYPENKKLLACVDEIDKTNAKRLSQSEEIELPKKGLVRREQYPWNTYEPDRYKDLDELNRMMQEVAPKLEIRAVQLPSLSSTDSQTTVTQLGVFAKEDISPGEAILTETSILTANNKLQDTLCDACSADLPSLTSPQIQSCDSCEAVFCSPSCHSSAQHLYHPALCDTDTETLAKDVPPTEAADALYSLLLLRTLAMAETQDVHPLELKEVKYIWGDFSTTTTITNERTLPFSFEQNIRLPLHMLEKMNIDIFATTGRYDVWVFNTLYAKFRGTASARLSGGTKVEDEGLERKKVRKIRGPEVSAVHPMWCMANHSCDPNVGWEWGGSVTFTAREERVAWEGKEKRAMAGIKKGEEVLNHYCDINLPVKERREWARGALGGDCQCERCVWEAAQAQAHAQEDG